MKGYGEIVIAVGVLAGLLLILLFVSIKGVADNSIREVININDDKVLMLYSLDAAKLYLETSLKYSIYQSCYDLLKTGVKGDFESELKKSVLGNLNKYSMASYDYMETYSVALPQYETISLTPAGNKIAAVADSKSALTTLKEKTIKGFWSETAGFEKPAKTEAAVVTPCFGIYQKGAAEKSEVEKTIPMALLDTKDDLGLKETYSVVGNYISEGNAAEKLLEMETGKTKAEIAELWKKGLKKIIEKTDFQSGEYVINVRLLDFSFDVIATCAAIENAVTECSGYEYRTKTKLSVSVRSAAAEKFPVWNGKEIKMEELTGNFIVEKQEAV